MCVAFWSDSRVQNFQQNLLSAVLCIYTWKLAQSWYQPNNVNHQFSRDLYTYEELIASTWQATLLKNTVGNFLHL